jgi:hypothetical protein
MATGTGSASHETLELRELLSSKIVGLKKVPASMLLATS